MAKSEVTWPVDAEVWAAALEEELDGLEAQQRAAGDKRNEDRIVEVRKQLDAVRGKAKRS